MFQIVTGDAEDAPLIGGEMTSNPAVRKVGFTGSTEVGKLLMAQCAKAVKRISLELGGNAPFIVLDDATSTTRSPARCCASSATAARRASRANRILVQDGIFDAFAERLTAAAAGLRVGLGTEPGVQVGPLIDEAALQKVQRHVDDARERGGELLTGGTAHELGRTFFTPTVLTGATADWAMSNEETFGPVAALQRFAAEEDAVRIANDTPYGLSAYLYSRDVGRIWRVSDALDYGIVGINTGFVSTEVAPFGGMKESGIGREGSRYGIDEWLEMKYLAMGGIDR